MAPRPDKGAVFAFPFPYADRGPTPIETVIPQKRKARPTSAAESSASELETADEHEEDGLQAKTGPSVWNRVRRELARSEPPLFPPFLRPPRRFQLKQQSISVLAAIMQRCIREQDFIRAGRAFGLLLRTESHGFNLDLRSRGLYGVGAELLLRQEPGDGPSSSGHQTNEEPTVGSPNRTGFTPENFAAAKAYYERLAIDYAFRPVSSSLVSSLDFYPIMYGLWISTVQDRYLQTLKTEHVPHTIADPMTPTDSDPAADSLTQQGKDLAREGAHTIEASLRELMISPPYSESAYLQTLQSMIGQWIRDLGRPTYADDRPAKGVDDPSSSESGG